MLTQTHCRTSEQTFLTNLHHQLEPHLTEADLSVGKLVRLLAMSRTDLHRKLERAAGMSATEYLRYLRLQKAAHLLAEEPEWSIYQVALEVGFNSQSYFTRRFREVFGCCPVAWRESSRQTCFAA